MFFKSLTFLGPAPKARQAATSGRCYANLGGQGRAPKNNAALTGGGSGAPNRVAMHNETITKCPWAAHLRTFQPPCGSSPDRNL